MLSISPWSAPVISSPAARFTGRNPDKTAPDNTYDGYHTPGEYPVPEGKPGQVIEIPPKQLPFIKEKCTSMLYKIQDGLTTYTFDSENKRNIFSKKTRTWRESSGHSYYAHRKPLYMSYGKVTFTLKDNPDKKVKAMVYEVSRFKAFKETVTFVMTNGSQMKFTVKDEHNSPTFQQLNKYLAERVAAARAAAEKRAAEQKELDKYAKKGYAPDKLNDIDI